MNDLSIWIDLKEKKLHLYRNQQVLLYSFPIAIGKEATPTPFGVWEIINKKILSENSAYGSRWLGLSAISYGIHGTNSPELIGKEASLGCIRMHNHDVETLFEMVPIGTKVTIINSSLHPLQQNTIYETYVIQPNDTFWNIAQKQNISFHELTQLNGHMDPFSLIIGDTLILPKK